MKSNSDLINGYPRQQIFKNEEDENHIMSLKEVEREKIIGERVLELKRQKERKELLNEKENKAKETKKSKPNYNEQSDSEEGELKEDKHRSKHKKSFESNGDESSLSVDDEDKPVKKESTNITLEDIKKIVLNRNFFEKYYFYPNFDEKVKGAFVRINLSSTDQNLSNYMGYSIFEIEQIVTKDKSYDFAGNKCNKIMKL